LRNWLGHRQIAAVIPKRQDEAGPNDHDKALYRERPVIEQTINRLKRFRRVATRDEKLTSSYLAMVTIAMILGWLELCQHTLASKRPCHHQRELGLPERVAVGPDPLVHDDVRTGIAQRARPPGRVLEEERLQRAGDEIGARKRARHHGRRAVAAAR
jgi:hypothetical protein